MTKQAASKDLGGDISKATAVKFVVLLGLVSLFADLTYEGARSINGPFLAVLGASATVVGVVVGFGELIGYGLRLVSGTIADRTGKFWTITILGYAVNLIAVPLLALVGRWEIAALLMIFERTGKAIRTPARDAMLSHATHRTGRGWGFGLHEAMDQIGAVAGPLVVAAVLAAQGSYQGGYAVLLAPALLSITALVAARFLYPRPRDFEVRVPQLEPQGMRRTFWAYLVAVALVAAAYADFPLIAYHFQKAVVVPASAIPVFYAIAMGVDALAALLFGHLFDRFGVGVLAVVSLASAFFAPLVFLGGFGLALVGMALWGIGMGAQESVMRAAVAGMTPSERRGAAYGIFNSGFGVAWFLGSALMGLLYEHALVALIVFSVALQLAAVPVFLLVARSWAPAREFKP